MIGGSFAYHPKFQEITLKLVDPEHHARGFARAVQVERAEHVALALAEGPEPCRQPAHAVEPRRHRR